MRHYLSCFMCFLLLCFANATHASIIKYTAVLSGLNESPVNASPGIGNATVDIDTVLNQLSLHLTFSGLLGTTTASHIHCCTSVPFTGTAGVATTPPAFAGFPLGVTSGTLDNVYDLTLSTFYNPAFVTAKGGTALAEAAFLAGMAQGETYLNIHTTVFQGGEIRGFLTPVSVPEPAGIALIGLGLLGFAASRRKSAK